MPTLPTTVVPSASNRRRSTWSSVSTGHGEPCDRANANTWASAGCIAGGPSAWAVGVYQRPPHFARHGKHLERQAGNLYRGGIDAAVEQFGGHQIGDADVPQHAQGGQT